MALSLQVFFPHASADTRLWQSRINWNGTNRRYGVQPTACDQIDPIDDGDQNIGGLLPLRYLCNRFW